jgi:hypothetical protein
MISSGTAGTMLSATARVSNLKAWAVCHSAAGASSRRPASSNSGYFSIKGAAGLVAAITVTLWQRRQQPMPQPCGPRKPRRLASPAITAGSGLPVGPARGSLVIFARLAAVVVMLDVLRVALGVPTDLQGQRCQSA